MRTETIEEIKIPFHLQNLFRRQFALLNQRCHILQQNSGDLFVRDRFA